MTLDARIDAGPAILGGLALDALAAVLAIGVVVAIERDKAERWRSATAEWTGRPAA